LPKIDKNTINFSLSRFLRVEIGTCPAFISKVDGGRGVDRNFSRIFKIPSKPLANKRKFSIKGKGICPPIPPSGYVSN